MFGVDYFLGSTNSHYLDKIDQFLAKALVRQKELKERIESAKARYADNPDLPEILDYYQEELDLISDDELQKVRERKEHMLRRGEIEALPVGTPVQITGVDPYWGYAGCGYPEVGTEGVISEECPFPDKQTVAFFGRLPLTDGSAYLRDDDPIRLYLPRDCFKKI